MRVNYKGMDLPEKTAAAIRKYRNMKTPINYVVMPGGKWIHGHAFWPADTIEFLYEQTFPFGDYEVLETFSDKVVGAFYHGNVSSEELEKEE
jgi:hypothetical protein